MMTSHHYARTIGLLGGSFNPAHAGHRQISLAAMRAGGLDEVWWLVSPQNPLKSNKEMADYAARIASAKAVAQHPHIQVSDFEARWNTHYTIDTLRRLKRVYPQFRFVWIMGADNLAQFHRWRNWQQIAAQVDILVIDRKPWTHRALRSQAALFMAAQRLNGHQRFSAGPSAAHHWRFVFGRISTISATSLRNTLGKNAFLAHNVIVERP